MNIIDVPQNYKGNMKKIADADKVIQGGVVIKDRHGIAGRRATTEEKRQAVKVR